MPKEDNINQAQSWYRKGNRHYDAGEHDQAVYCYKQAVDLFSDFKEAYNNLGLVLSLNRRYQEALGYLQVVVNKFPQYTAPYINMGILYELQSQAGRAKICYQKAIEIEPHSLEANLNLGGLYELDGAFDKALTCYYSALKNEPHHFKLHLKIGGIFHQRMELDSCLQHFKLALQDLPDCLEAKIKYHLTLPIIYRNTDEITYYRKRFDTGLQKIISGAGSDSKKLKDYQDIINNFTPFYLQYQGENDTDIQKRFGGFVHQIMAAGFPEWVKKRKMPRVKKGEKLRVGYVSSYMQFHSVGKFIIGWLRNHNRDVIKIHSYYINQKVDALTDQYKTHSDIFHHIPNDIRAAARQILKDDLHILIFTDIGMYPPATMLAGLRLAPIQCVTWGHPVTTGLPTMNYFLSSDLMEPIDGQEHYSEELVRLPNLALAQKPDMLPKAPKSRDEFNLPQGAFVYFSSQSIYKYLPQYDYIFPEIAKDVPNSIFVFIAHLSSYVTRVFKERLEKAFLAYGLNFTNYCKILPRLGKSDFLALNAGCDVLLDSFEWSGCNSTMEGISCGKKPVVTYPGEFMRGRHSYAMLKMMGVEETIAKDPQDYISIAVRLGRNHNFYDKIKEKMLNNYQKIFNDISCVEALEQFFVKVYQDNVSTD